MARSSYHSRTSRPLCSRGERSLARLLTAILIGVGAWFWLAAPAVALEPAQRLQRQGAEACVLASDFHAPGVAGWVSTSVEYDDGRGSVLVVAGAFEAVEGVRALNIASWNGQRWSPLGPGLNGLVRSLAVYDDGTGPALYAGGDFALAGRQRVDHIARWDGTTWSPVGQGRPTVVYALTVHDDGDGPALYAGGYGTDQPLVAKWDGSTWSPLPSGPSGRVEALESYTPAGGNPMLFAAGSFEPFGDSQNRTDAILAWDGDTWRNLGGGILGAGRSLAVYDDGGGAALYVGGFFRREGLSTFWGIASWDGQAWRELPNPSPRQDIQALGVFDDGGGARLYAATSSGSAHADIVSSWDGTAWSGVLADGAASYHIHTLTAFEDDSGSALFAGGWFPQLKGQVAFGLGRWDGDAWSRLRDDSVPPGHGLDSTVLAWTEHDDGSGSALYAAGFFTHSADGARLDRIARWTGDGWTPLGTGMDDGVLALTSFDAGDGPRLIAGGTFHLAGDQVVNSIAAWDGEAWQAMGTGFDSSVSSLAVYDAGTGPQLYAAGWFEGGIARWNGQAWEGVGPDPLNPGVDGGVVEMFVADEAGGPALYLIGSFRNAGDAPASGLARWDGSAWSSAADLLPIEMPTTFAVFDDGSGPAIFIAGLSFNYGVSSIYRWDGSTWEIAGQGQLFETNDFQVLDDGNGPALYAVGRGILGHTGGSAGRVVRWDGGSWRPVGPAFNYHVLSLTLFDDGSGPSFFAGGYFTAVGGRFSAQVAKLTCGN